MISSLLMESGYLKANMGLFFASLRSITKRKVKVLIFAFL